MEAVAMAEISLLRGKGLGKGTLLTGGESISSNTKGFWGYSNARNSPSTIRFPQARHTDGNGDRTKAETMQKFCVGIVAATWTLGSDQGLSTVDGWLSGPTSAESAALSPKSSASLSSRHAALESHLFNAQGLGASENFQPLALSVREDFRDSSTELAGDDSNLRQVNIASDAEAYERQTKDNGLCDIRCIRADPVCGTNGVTYWCGAPEAKCAGVDVAYDSKCVKGDSGLAEKAIRALQSLLSNFLGLVNEGSPGKEDFHINSGPNV